MLNLTLEERDDLRKIFETSTGNWFDVALKVADRAVFLVSARASGQVKEDAEEVEKAIEDLMEIKKDVRSQDARLRARRLAALAQEAESLRAKVAELESQIVVEREYRDERVREVQAPLRARVAELESALTAEKASDRVKERSDAWAAMHPNGSCTCGGEGTCSWCYKATHVCENCEKLQRRHDFLANEIAKMGPIAKDLLVAQARVAELEEQLTATQKERDASSERAQLWFTELVALRKEKTEALQIAGNASPSSGLRSAMRQKQAAIADLHKSIASWRDETEKHRKRAAKWKRRAQKAALDFYEGFLIGHKIGQAETANPSAQKSNSTPASIPIVLDTTTKG